MKFECSLSAVWRSVAIALARGLASQESRSIRCRIRPDARALRATSNPPDRCSSSPGQRAAPCPRSRDLVRFVSRVVVAQAAPRLRKAAIGAVSVPRDEPWPPVSGAPPVQFRSPSASASARLVHAGAPSVQFQARGPGRHMMSEDANSAIGRSSSLPQSGTTFVTPDTTNLHALAARTHRENRRVSSHPYRSIRCRILPLLPTTNTAPPKNCRTASVCSLARLSSRNAETTTSGRPSSSRSPTNASLRPGS